MRKLSEDTDIPSFLNIATHVLKVREKHENASWKVFETISEILLGSEVTVIDIGALLDPKDSKGLTFFAELCGK